MDASSTALVAALIQEGQPTSYVSKALTSTYQKYSQIEKELSGTLKRLRGHLGIGKTQMKERNVLSRPDMAAEITEEIKKSPVCLENRHRLIISDRRFQHCLG